VHQSVAVMSLIGWTARKKNVGAMPSSAAAAVAQRRSRPSRRARRYVTTSVNAAASGVTRNGARFQPKSAPSIIKCSG
jgi:hypothetical protein